ncbi:hypothetical protein QOT17_012647 [Balamuthia mandrillaris]
MEEETSSASILPLLPPLPFATWAYAPPPANHCYFPYQQPWDAFVQNQPPSVFSERDSADGQTIDDEREEEEGDQDEEEAVVATPELDAGGGFVLSEEAIAMFARGEARREQERRQRLQQQQEEALAEERAAALQEERLEAEARQLYGLQGLLRVRAMEETLERDFQQQCARTKPTLWPNMPLKL